MDIAHAKAVGRICKKYGLTPAQLHALVAATPTCSICGRAPKPGKDLYIDHNHQTGAVRGRTCFTCNYRLIGHGLDKPALHRAAAAYLSTGTDWRLHHV